MDEVVYGRSYITFIVDYPELQPIIRPQTENGQLSSINYLMDTSPAKLISMFNFIKLLFRKELVFITRGKVNWIGEGVSERYAFYCYDGLLGRCFQYEGPYEFNYKTTCSYQSRVKPWLEGLSVSEISKMNTKDFEN